MAETNVAGDTPGSIAGGEGIATPADEPQTPPTDSATVEPGALEHSAATTRLTRSQQAQRGLVIVTSAVVCSVLLAPIALAALAALVALVTDGLAALTIARHIRDGGLLQTGDAMNALSVASRIGFLAVGYLGLLFALIALLAGLLGRGQGRLFIIPGALLTASALVLFATSVALCWPLLALLDAPRAALVAVALYVALDTVALATLLADTRDTRRRWFSIRHKTAPTTPAPAREAPPSPPTLPPPTLAGA